MPDTTTTTLPAVDENTAPTTPDTSTNYLAALTEMKSKTVSKEAYEKLEKENKELLETLINGGQIQTPQAAPKKDINQLRKELYSNPDNLNNLDYWTKTLELRDAIIESGQTDPFLPVGYKVAPTADDVQKAENVANVVRECINYADGDSRLFTQELQRRTVDTAPTARRGRR